MNMLSLIRWIYPQSFVERFGDEWMATAEDLMEVAKQRGRLETLVQLIMLTVDAGVWGNVLRWRLIQEAVIGKPPVLAGAGWAGGTISLMNHWGTRPARGLVQGVHKHLFALIVGLCGAAFIYCGLENIYAVDFSNTIFRLAQGWERNIGGVLWVMLGAGVAGWLISMLLRPTSSISMRSQAIGVAGVLFMLVWVLLTSINSISMAFPGMLLMGLVAWFSHHKYIEWKRQGFPLMMPVIGGMLGLYVGIHGLFFYDILKLGRSPEVVATFVSFPHLRDYPARYPDEHWNDPSKWTTEQKQWFWIDPQNPNDVKIQPEKLSQWCAMKMSSIKTEEVMLRAAPDENIEIATLLWQGRLKKAAVEGCITIEEMLAQDSNMAEHVRQSVSRTTQVWEPMASWSPLISRVVVSRYIIMPRIIPNIERYCHAMGGKLASDGVLPRGREFDHVKIHTFCMAQQEIMRPDIQRPKRSWWHNWQNHYINPVPFCKEEVAHMRPVQPHEIDVLREALMSNMEQWTSSMHHPKSSNQTPAKQ